MNKKRIPRTNYSPPTIRVNILFTLLLLSTSTTSSEELKNTTIKNIHTEDSTTDKKIDSNDVERVNRLSKIQRLNDNIYFDPQISAEKIKKIILFEWQLFHENENQYFYVNQHEIWRNSNELTIPIYSNYKIIFNGAKSVTLLIKIDCSTSKKAIIDLNAWSEPNGEGYTVSYINKSHKNYPTWKPIKPSTEGDLYFTFKKEFCPKNDIGIRPQLFENRIWAPMMGAISYENQISRFFKSHIVSKGFTSNDSKVEVIIQINSHGIVNNIKLIKSTGDSQWERNVMHSLKFISSKYQIRSPFGYGKPGILKLTFKP